MEIQNGKKELLGKIKQETKEWLSNSTSHGIPNIARTSKLSIRIMWGLSVIISAAICSYLVISGILDFFEYPVVTKIDTVNEVPAVFPAVTICNGQPFTTLKATEFVATILSEYGIYEEDLFKYPSEFNQSMNPVLSYMRALKTPVQSLALLTSTSDELKEFNLPLNKFLLTCNYNSACDLSKFKHSYEFLYGNCYSFNTGFDDSGNKVPLLYSTSQYDSLDLEIFVGMSKSPLTLSANNGIAVHIHNQSVNQHYDMPIMVQPGVATNLVVSREFTEKLPRPFNDCLNDLSGTSYYKYLQDTPFTYRQNDCLQYMNQLEIIDACGCYLTMFPKPDTDKPICWDAEDLICVEKIYTNFFSSENIEKHAKDCPLECNSQILSMRSEFSLYPTETYAAQLATEDFMLDRFKYVTNETVTTKMVQESLLILRIWYGNMRYKITTETEKTSTVDLIAGIGGTLGLFLGISFLSFVEIVEMLLVVIDLLQKKKTEASNRVSEEPPAITIIADDSKQDSGETDANIGMEPS